MNATDLSQLIANLDAEAIQEYLDRLVREAAALRVLLRSARARERSRAHRDQREEAPRASR
jgi:hypothetical protein